MRTTEPALVWISRPENLTEIRRIAAAAECSLAEIDPPPNCGASSVPADVTEVPSELRRRWQSAPRVLLDSETASLCRSAGLPKRPGVVVVHGIASEEPPAQWRDLIALGVSEVCTLPGGEAALVEALGRQAEAQNGSGYVVAVTGSCGGVGTSTFATALSLAHTGQSLLVDADATGPGLDLILGAESEDGLRWPDLHNLSGRISADALWAALPSVGRVSVLSHTREVSDDLGRQPVSQEAFRAVAEAAKAAGALCVIDLPDLRSSAGEVYREIADLVVMVSSVQLRACAAARIRAQALRDCPSGVVVRGPSVGGLGAKDVSRAAGLELLAVMRSTAGLGEQLERGGLHLSKRSALRAAAQKVLHKVVAA